jgi:hypothetical protein
MKKNKAILIIQNQIDKSSDEDNRNESWLIETKTYIFEFFGNNSEQSNFLKSFTWIQRSRYLDKTEYEKLKNIKGFLNDCISVISNIGVYKKPINNWFYQLPNWVITLSLTALCFVSFGIGILFTTNNNSELRNENSKLKEKLINIPSDTISDNHKNLKNKPK